MSSIKHTIPSKPVNTSLILRWKYSGAEVIPNGSRLKAKHPNGVMKVVSFDDSGESCICQNPEFALSLEKYLAPLIYANVCSTDGKSKRSR